MIHMAQRARARTPFIQSTGPMFLLKGEGSGLVFALTVCFVSTAEPPGEWSSRPRHWLGSTFQVKQGSFGGGEQ